MDQDVIDLLYIVAFMLFIAGLAQLRNPTSAVRGNRTAAVGMAIAVIATLLRDETGIPLVFAAIIGSISFWGSNIAFGKLQELISGRPLKIPGGVFINGGLLA